MHKGVDTLKIQSSSKKEYDNLLETYKKDGYKIIERGSYSDGEWYFKCCK